MLARAPLMWYGKDKCSVCPGKIQSIQISGQQRDTEQARACVAGIADTAFFRTSRVQDMHTHLTS